MSVEELSISLDNLRLSDQNISRRLKIRLAGIPELLSEEGYSKWFSEVADSITVSKISSIVSMLEEYQLSGTTNDSFEIYFTNDFGSQINLTFVYILRNLKEEAFKGIQVLQSFLKEYLLRKGEIDAEAERLQGATFAMESLKMVAKVWFEFGGPEEAMIAWTNRLKFEELDSKAKGFVFGLKGLFQGEFNRNPPLELETADKAIQADPEHWEWHINKYKLLRWHRRSKDNWGHPTPEELSIIKEAYRLNPTHPICLLRTCQFLAEYVKSSVRGDRRAFPLRFGLHDFKSENEVVSFLKQESNELYFADKFWMVEFAKNFSSDLPWQYRDRIVAKGFLDRAVQLDPNSSRINHRMGVFLGQDNDYSRAEVFLKRAMDLSPLRNLPARFDLIKAYMRNLRPNSLKLRRIFEMEMLDSTSSKIPIQIMFLRGYFHFKLEEYQTALQAWNEIVTSFREEPDILKQIKDNFTNLKNQERDWGWPPLDFGVEMSKILQILLPRGPQESRPVSDTLIQGAEAARGQQGPQNRGWRR